MIERQSVAGVKLDGIKSLGDSIRNFWVSHLDDFVPENPLTLWKSDVAVACWQMPMHPLWQIKQVININGKLLGVYAPLLLGILTLSPIYVPIINFLFN